MPFGEVLKHDCGVYAIFAPDQPVAWKTARALDMQQTRGQEGAGIATTDGERFHIKTGKGLVIQVFRSPKSVKRLTGFAAIGHNRYSTTGRDKRANLQPLKVSGPKGEICLGQNGNIVNANELREELEALGQTFVTTTDSEVIAKLIVNTPGKTWVDCLKIVMPRLQGSYCLAILTNDSIILARDPTGNRPLFIAKANGSWAAASESGIFNNQSIEEYREVLPGEIIVFDEQGMTSYKGTNHSPIGLCVFEWDYFLRPDSEFHGVQAYGVRYRAGQTLARNYPVEADLVVPVPRSGFYAADGYTAESGIPMAHGIVANLFSRAFIDPDQLERELKLELKYSTTGILAGMRVIVIDDSIVRGNSNNRVVQILKMAGASEIHIRSTFPPIIDPCYFGIDMATVKELIAAQFGREKRVVEDKLTQHWGVTSVRYLSVEEFVEAIGLPTDILCLSCIGGRSAIEIPEFFLKEAFERGRKVAV